MYLNCYFTQKNWLQVKKKFVLADEIYSDQSKNTRELTKYNSSIAYWTITSLIRLKSGRKKRPGKCPKAGHREPVFQHC